MTINKALAKQRQLPEGSIVAIEVLHQILKQILARPGLSNDPVKEIESLEYTLQMLWGFPVDPNFHTYWYKIDGCTCPKLDNEDHFGHSRIIDNNCKWHGDAKL